MDQQGLEDFDFYRDFEYAGDHDLTQPDHDRSAGLSEPERPLVVPDLNQRMSPTLLLANRSPRPLPPVLYLVSRS